MYVARTPGIKLVVNQNVLVAVLLSLIIILGTALRFYNLGTESYSYDETIMVNITSSDPLPILNLGLRGGRPPVLVYLGYFWVQAFGTSEVATRSFSAVVGVAAIVVLFALGQKLFGYTVGLISALLMAISWFHIFYSQDFRYYSLLTLTTLISFFFYIRVLETAKLKYIILYALAGIVVFFTHTYGIFILVTQGLYFMLQWKRYPKLRVYWLLSQFVIVFALAWAIQTAWVDYLATFDGTFQGMFAAMHHLVDVPLWVPLHTLFVTYLFGGVSNLIWMPLVASLVFLIGGTFLFFVRQGKEQWFAALRDLASQLRQEYSTKRSELILMILWLFCPVFLPYILSKLLGPVYLARYTIGALPALCLFLALGITAIRKVVPEFVTVGVLIILIVPGLYRYYVTDVKDQWRETAAYVSENAAEGDALVFVAINNGFSSAVQNAFNMYHQSDLPECRLSTYYMSRDQIQNALDDCGSDRERFWLVTRVRNSDEDELIKSYLLDDIGKGMHLIDEQSFRKTKIYLVDLD